jgi:hypothetical protein
MEEIWKSVAKTDKKGVLSILFKGSGDLAFLYLSGFVDITKNTFKDWIDAFASSKQKDGSYTVTHDQWLEKKKFRYEGPVGAPFDPNSVQEKEYTEEEFTQLLHTKIIPNTQFDASAAPRIMETVKKQNKFKDGKVILDKTLKKELVDVINTYPHPLHILRTMVQAIREGKGEEALTKFTQSEAQKSNFAAGKTAQQIAQARFAEIAKALQADAIPESKVPSISLKDLKKGKTPKGRI